MLHTEYDEDSSCDLVLVCYWSQPCILTGITQGAAAYILKNDADQPRQAARQGGILGNIFITLKYFIICKCSEMFHNKSLQSFSGRCNKEEFKVGVRLLGRKTGLLRPVR